MKPLLSIKNLSAGYGGKPVLSGVSFDLNEGEMTALLGPNGSGKSTLLYTVAGQIKPISGEIELGGKPLGAIKERALARVMSVVLTERFRTDFASVFEVAAMGRIPHTGYMGILTQRDRDAVAESLDMVGMSALSERSFMSLSDGEKQKTLIARALAQEPRIILLDEPTSHLDINNRFEIMAILTELAREKNLAILLSLHDVDLALKSCRRVVMLKDGAIFARGVPEDVAGEGVIDRLYGIKSATYDPLLGSVELYNGRRPEVFVVAEGGSGVPFYRAFTKAGVGVATGVLNVGGVGLRAARAMGLSVISCGGPCGASDAEQEAKRLISEMACAVDSGFEAQDPDGRNMRLLREYARSGGRVVSIRKEDEARSLFGDRAVAAASFSEAVAAAIEMAEGERNEI